MIVGSSHSLYHSFCLTVLLLTDSGIVCHNTAVLLINNMAPLGNSTKSHPPGVSKRVFCRMLRANQFLGGGGASPPPCHTKHYKNTQLAFDVGKAVVLDTPIHECCKHRRLCFDAKGHLSGQCSNLIPCPAMHCLSQRNMEMRILHKKFTQNPFTKATGPDLVEHTCSGAGGCSAWFVTWEFISGGENIMSILVRKDLCNHKHLPGHWADWMLNIQETLEADQ